MKIIINASSIYKGGAEQVANSFINECKDIFDHEYHVLLRENIKSQLKIDEFPKNFVFYDIKKRPGSSLISLYKSLRYFDEIEKKIHPDVVISTGSHGFWRPKAPVVGGFNIPHYVYPESPYFKKINKKKKLYWYIKKKIDLFFYRRLNTIFVQTDDVRKRLINLVPDIPIYTVSNTVNGVFLNKDGLVNRKKFLPDKEPGEFRLLTVSAYYPHKNLDSIVNVLEVLLGQGKKNIKFIVTLPDEIFKTFIPKKFKDYVINIGPIPIDDCPQLYSECDVMFLPTLLECFSASYAEAMSMGKPILTSDLGFAHTVCNNSALYFDPMNKFDIVNKIERLMTDSALYHHLVSEGEKEFKKFLTPEERAKKYLEICEMAVTKN